MAVTSKPRWPEGSDVESATFSVVLFLHITAAIAGLMIAAVLHAGLMQMRRARTIAEIRAWGPTIARLESLFPVVAVALFGLGAWLLHLSGGEFRWSDGWVITAVASLAVVEAVGAGVLGRRSKVLIRRVEAEPDGPVSSHIRRAALDPPLWLSAHGTTAAVIGIVCLMATKPSGVISVAIVLSASVIGLLTTLPLLRVPGQGAPGPAPGRAVPPQAASGARTVPEAQQAQPH
jgi:hypothetical protein